MKTKNKRKNLYVFIYALGKHILLHMPKSGTLPYITMDTANISDEVYSHI